MAGKGDTRRPCDEDAYAKNWERIFGETIRKQKEEGHACLECAYDEPHMKVKSILGEKP